MLQLAFKNYINAFRWQNIKEKYHNGGWFSLFYLLLILPMVVSGYDFEDTTGLICLLIMLPSIFAMFASILFPSMLPKIMYLSPMSKEMRKEYLLKASLIRTIVPIIMSVIVVSITTMVGLTDILCAFGIFLNNSVFAVFLGSGINKNGYGTIDKNNIRTLAIEDSYSFQEFIIVIVTIIISVCYASIVMETDPLWVRILFIGITLLIPLPATMSYLKYWPSALENALCYEHCLKKPTKQQK